MASASSPDTPQPDGPRPDAPDSGASDTDAPDTDASPTDDHSARKRAMELVARAPVATLRDVWAAWPDAPDHAPLRGPETGMIMIRGRMGGGGAPFNLGETTVSRATVRLATGEVGFSCVLGRDTEKASLAAAFDGLWQRPGDRQMLETGLLRELEQAEADADRRTREEAAATRVNFFTMVRGEDE